MKNNPMSDEEFKEYMKFDDSHEMDINDVEWQRQPLGREVKEIKIYNTYSESDSDYIDYCLPADVNQLIADHKAVAETLQKRIDELEAGKWISVDDRLPEDKQNVLICEKDSLGIYYYSVGYQEDSDWYLEYNSEPLDCATHWQPLPLPPKELKC